MFPAAFSNWNAHNDQMLGAALAYYTVLSMAPLLVVVLAIAGMAFGKDAAQGQIMAELQSLIGPQGAKVIQIVVATASAPKTGTIASIAGFVVLLFSAAGVFNALRDSLNLIWEAKPPASGFWTTLRGEFLSFGMVLGIGFLLMVSLILSAAIAAVGKFVGNLLPVPEVALHAVNFVGTFAVVTFLFAAIYRILPAKEIPWEDVWIGAAFTSLLYSIGKLAIGLYLGKASVGSAYGAAGSLVVLLVWIYYSAQVFFLGAEFTHVYANSHGSRSAEPDARAGGSTKVQSRS
jgi:membrane protein